jgi:hypothetical protein
VQAVALVVERPVHLDEVVVPRRATTLTLSPLASSSMRERERERGE